MAFGGGSFVTQNKILPGVYVNVNQQGKAGSNLSDRSVAALGLELDWGPDKEVFLVDSGEFRTRAQSLFGYAYGEAELKGLRDLFLHAGSCYFYRLNSGAKAGCALCEAKWSGERGNSLVIKVNASQEEPGSFEVLTFLAGQEVDSQQAASAADLVNNDFVCWKSGAELSADMYVQLSGGTNKEKVGSEDYQSMLDLLSEYEFNVLGCLSTDAAVKALLVKYTKEQREDNGRKFQTVLYDYAANYEGIISAGCAALDEDMPESGWVYWLTGAEAGCAVNATLTNAVYDGEIKVQALSGQREMQQALLDGRLVLHRLNGELRVLEDVNSLQGWQENGQEDRRFNQTIRVLDQIVLDLAGLFYQRYLGIVPNDNAGRISLWSDVVAYYRKLEGLRAIESFDTADVTVEQGENKKSVVIGSYLTVTNAMSQLYLTVTFN